MCHWIIIKKFLGRNLPLELVVIHYCLEQFSLNEVKCYKYWVKSVVVSQLWLAIEWIVLLCGTDKEWLRKLELLILNNIVYMLRLFKDTNFCGYVFSRSCFILMFFEEAFGKFLVTIVLVNHAYFVHLR